MDSIRLASPPVCQKQRQSRRPCVMALVGSALVAATFVPAPSFIVGPAKMVSRALPQDRQLQRRHAYGGAGYGGMGDAHANAKSALRQLLSEEMLQQEVLRPEGKPMRGRVDEAIIQLEKFSPVEEPSYSEFIDGSWKVSYAGSYSPGMLSSPTRELALFLYGGFSLGSAFSSFVDGFWGQTAGLSMGSKTVQITDGRDVYAEAEVKISFPVQRSETVRYKAELMPISGRRLSEEVTSFELPTFGQQDVPLEIRRSILVTYLDGDMLIVRDESGLPEVLERMVDAAPVQDGDDGVGEGVDSLISDAA